MSEIGGSQNIYEFDGLCLDVERSEIVRLIDGARFSIRPKERDFLCVLLEHQKETVAYGDLHQIVWPEVVDFQSAIRTMRETKRTLDALLRDLLKSPTHIIKTVVNEGYCVRATVISNQHTSQAETTSYENADARFPLRDQASVNVHIGLSCVLYSLVFATALPLEVAYKWDEFGRRAVLLAAPVFAWVLTTSILGLKLDEQRTASGRKGGLAVAVAIFIAATFLLLVGLSFFLPNIPITQSSIQSYPAQAACVKDAASLLLLAFFFLILPTHFVFALRGTCSPEREGSPSEFNGDQLIMTVARRLRELAKSLQLNRLAVAPASASTR